MTLPQAIAVCVFSNADACASRKASPAPEIPNRYGNEYSTRVVNASRAR